jgi:protein xylosyltransferase
MGANGRADSPSSTKTPPRGGAAGVELYSPSTKSPRAGSLSSLLPTGLAASLFDRRWAISGAVTVFLFIVATLTVTSTSSSSASFFSFFPSSGSVELVQHQQAAANVSSAPRPPHPGANVPRLAYLVSGSKGDLDRLWRALHALYHPRNLYVVHLDREAPVGERLELARRVANSTVFRRVGNVEVIRRANMVTYRGPTMVANTLHACAMLLRRSRDWDWFINLSASDYPLMTQDGTYLHHTPPIKYTN